MVARLTPENVAYARGYFQCFLDEKVTDELRDSDYDNWFQDGEVDFNLYFSEGWAVVDAYPVENGNTVTKSRLRILDEHALENEV